MDRRRGGPWTVDVGPTAGPSDLGPRTSDLGPGTAGPRDRGPRVEGARSRIDECRLLARPPPGRRAVLLKLTREETTLQRLGHSPNAPQLLEPRIQVIARKQVQCPDLCEVLIDSVTDPIAMPTNAANFGSVDWPDPSAMLVGMDVIDRSSCVNSTRCRLLRERTSALQTVTESASARCQTSNLRWLCMAATMAPPSPASVTRILSVRPFHRVPPPRSSLRGPPSPVPGPRSCALAPRSEVPRSAGPSVSYLCESPRFHGGLA